MTGTKATIRLLPDADDCARARSDGAFRNKLLAEHLELLLGALARLRKANPDPGRARQIREGVDMAVKLSAMLQK
jgi:hypothetical protein